MQETLYGYGFIKVDNVYTNGVITVVIDGDRLIVNEVVVTLEDIEYMLEEN